MAKSKLKKRRSKQIKATGNVEIEHWRDGTLLSKETKSNLIVDDGLERIAKLLTSGVVATAFGYIALGTGTTSPIDSDSALETEVTREQADDSGGSYEVNFKAIFEHTFTFGSGESYAITEAGVFDSLTESGSTMLDRVTFTAKNVVASDTLYIKFTITVSTV